MELLFGLVVWLLPIVGFVFIVVSLMGIKRSVESIDTHLSRISRSFERYLNGLPADDLRVEEADRS